MTDEPAIDDDFAIEDLDADGRLVLRYRDGRVERLEPPADPFPEMP